MQVHPPHMRKAAENGKRLLRVSRTNLRADEQVRDTGSVLLQLGHPFFTHILEAGGVDHREADEEDIGHRVGQRPQAVVVLLGEDRAAPVNNQKIWFTPVPHIWETLTHRLLKDYEMSSEWWPESYTVPKWLLSRVMCTRVRVKTRKECQEDDVNVRVPFLTDNQLLYHICSPLMRAEHKASPQDAENQTHCHLRYMCGVNDQCNTALCEPDQALPCPRQRWSLFDIVSELRSYKYSWPILRLLMARFSCRWSETWGINGSPVRRYDSTRPTWLSESVSVLSLLLSATLNSRRLNTTSDQDAAKGQPNTGIKLFHLDAFSEFNSLPKQTAQCAITESPITQLQTAGNGFANEQNDRKLLKQQYISQAEASSFFVTRVMDLRYTDFILNWSRWWNKHTNLQALCSCCALVNNASLE